MVRAIAQTRPDEIDCDACFAAMDQFAAMVRAGSLKTDSTKDGQKNRPISVSCGSRHAKVIITKFYL